MPHRLALPKKLSNEGWKVKIRTSSCLRTGQFMVPPGGSWRDIHPDVRAPIEEEATWQGLRDA